MKRKYIALITALLITGTAVAGCGTEDTVSTTSTTSAISADTGSEELSAEEEVEEGNLVWTVDDIALLDGIITGVGDYELSLTSDELDGVTYDDSIILDVEVDLSGVDSTTAGEYDAVYLISADRAALLAYINENEIALDDALLAELNAYAGDTVIIEVPVIVTVIEDSGEASEDTSEDTDTAAEDDGTEDETTVASSKDTTNSTSSNSSSSSNKSTSSNNSNSSSNKSTSSSSGSSSSGNSSSKNSSSSSGSSSSSSTKSASSGSNSSSSSNKSSSSGSSSSSSNKSSSSSSTSSSNSSSSSSSSSSNSSSSSSSASTHKHSYTSKVTKAATCGSTGIKTYTCSCGASYTETIAATGNHTWEETGYYKTVTVTDTAAYDEKVAYDYITCNTCGKEFYSYAEYDADATCSIKHGAYTITTKYKTVHHDAVTHTEQQWVSTGYKCTVCGKTK